MRNMTAMRAVVDCTASNLGRIDVVVNSADYGLFGVAEDSPTNKSRPSSSGSGVSPGDFGAESATLRGLSIVACRTLQGTPSSWEAAPQQASTLAIRAATSLATARVSVSCAEA
jgi:NAD(P)-dependent dehydrogenase (short-subunit alcohol dehydrogenase family)